MEQREHNLVVRNTFIDAVVADEDTYEPPGRTRSDPTGGRHKEVLPLGRIPERPQPIPLREGTPAEEAGEEEPAHAGGQQPGNLCGIDEEGSADELAEEEEEEDDDESDGGGLARTVSTAYTQDYASSVLAAGAGRGLGSSGVTTMALNRLLPAGDEASLAAAASMYPGMLGAGGMPQWGFGPCGMYGGMGSMYPFPYPQAAEMQRWDGQEAAEQQGWDGQEASAPSDWRTPALQPLGAGPPLGALHSFHQETRDMGQVSPDFRMFTKVGYEGRLSVVSESRVHTDGVHRYLVQFSSGELSRADGVGFVFSPRLPCAKNVQRIVSIFVNQRGRICMRIFADIVRASAYVKPLELGDWVEMAVDLDQKVATFNIWPSTPTGWPPASGRPTSTAEFPFGNKLARLNQEPAQGGRRARTDAQAAQKPVKLNVGHLACIIKNVGVTVTLSS